MIDITPANNDNLDTVVVGLLNNLNRFCISLDSTLINCEIELNFSWLKYWLISKISKKITVGEVNPADAIKTTSATFKMISVEL